MHSQSFLYILAALPLILAAPTSDGHSKREDATFDYVIVGGGTAGLTMAARLSEDSETTVAVIEAGSFYEVTDPVLSSTPAGDSFWIGSSPLDTNPLVDWNFVTTPQAGAAGRSIHYARECSFHSPGTSRAPNASAKYSASAFSTSGGPLEVSYANYASPFSSYMDGAFGEIGIDDAEDFNSGSILGKQYCSSTIDPSNENRESSQTAYYDSIVQKRTNLKVYSATMAQKVLFDSSKRATGVRVETLGFQYTIHAQNEVIMSAGAFQSPQLLMLSGIGPRETLDKWNIPAVSVLEGVGQNMWDHIFFGPTYRVKVQTFTRLANDLVYTLAEFVGPYLIEKLGPLTNPICDYLGWEKVPSKLRNTFSKSVLDDLSQFPEDWPEIEYLSGAGYVGNFASLPTTQPRDGYQYATILTALVAPLSRGSVTLASSSADVLPIINPSWLTSPADQAVAIAAYKRVREAFASKYMEPVIIGSEYFPGSSVSSDEEILSTIQETLHTVWHAACTCKMGKKEDPMAVVDSKAKVFGVSGLRVVDASAFAILPPGHPQSTIYALAEKIAADIKES
ncbi:hypothetical protein DID88_000543 [Monilinia fructigena]|uniref:Glucose-methanol-choline oxidoreductase N-terminal domain-containing protein n=1 Tax=Monilinia fructigena TaxID=38457 RepID=A0A395IIC1_9HELO|nr:hypothetical protein DID88_000543 [Monilinia fructigena]